MPRFAPFRLLLPLALPLAIAAQVPSSTLPPASPTQATLPVLPSQTATRPAAADQSARRARVTWMNNQLAITADNSSLNQILLDISRQTGMKITGGVRDERVFGNYGPAETGSVLATLLTGTGSNMLLKEARNDQPLELVLTPRQGGPTPPSPASFRQADDDSDSQNDRPAQRVRPPMPLPPPTNIQSVSQQVNDQNQQPAAAPSDPPAASGVRTPQQIYDQLMKLQQQKAATPPQDQ